MPDPGQSAKAPRADQWLRRVFRWLRIGVLLSAALIIALFLWGNVIGVPRWVGEQIRKELARRSIHVEFARLRLKGFRHLVATDVRLRSASTTNAPSFTVREAEFVLDFQQVRNGNFSLSGVRLVSGTLVLPVDARTERALAVSNITAEVLLLPGDTVQVANFAAETLGARATLRGELKRFSRFRFASAGPGTTTTTDWQRSLAQVLDVAEELQFDNPPELSVSLQADGADLPATRASVTLRAKDASSRWGKFGHLELSSSIAPLGINNAVQGKFLAVLGGFQSEFGGVGSLQFEGETLWSHNMEVLLTNTVQVRALNIDSRWFRSPQADAMVRSSQVETNAPIRSTIELSTDAIEAPGLAARTNSFSAELEHPLPFPTPAVWLAHLFSGQVLERAGASENRVTGQWRGDSLRLRTSRADFDAVQLRGGIVASTNRSSDRSLGPWRFFSGLEIPWRAQITNIHAGDIFVGSLDAEGNWEFPRLALARLEAQLHGGYLRGAADLDVTTRRAAAKVESKFDYLKTSVLLDKPVQNWVSQFTWQDPPAVEGVAIFQFPAWTNSSGQFRSHFLTSLQLSGGFAGKGEFRGIPVDQAAGRFAFSDFVWNLPDLIIQRPEGAARIRYTGNVTNSDFACTIESRLDPAALKPLFSKDQQPALAMVKFSQPPLIHAEVSGNWEDEARMTARASLVATNFFVKEQAFSDLKGNIALTNGIITATDVLAHRGSEEARAPFLHIDISGEVMFVTNLVSTIDPYIAMSLVGEDAYNAIDPYRFASRPTVGVNGIVPLRHWSKADLHFDVVGDEFSFWKFRMPTLAGHVHWRSNVVTFSNVVANFYGGKARWSGRFAIDPRKGEDYAIFSFAGYTTNTEIKHLVADITGRTNQMEGILHGSLIITSASTADDRSWNGYGEATLEDGFLWNVPVFGVFSPILDGIAPGLGSSRISAGSGTFSISNSVVHTRDMQVRAPAFRLAYKGQVDLDGNLDAIAEAMIFRDVWVVGRLFSAAFWPVSKAFEAKISGTLDAPKTQLRYVPKFLLAPFRALNAISGAARGKNQPEKGLEGPAGAANPAAQSPRQ